MAKTAIECAYEILENKESLSFKDLWSEIKTSMNYDDITANKKMAQFYTDICLDGRFISLEKNTWSLRAKAKYDQVVVNPEDIEEDAIPVRDEDGYIIDPEDMKGIVEENTEEE